MGVAIECLRWNSDGDTGDTIYPQSGVADWLDLYWRRHGLVLGVFHSSEGFPSGYLTFFFSGWEIGKWDWSPDGSEVKWRRWKEKNGRITYSGIVRIRYSIDWYINTIIMIISTYWIIPIFSICWSRLILKDCRKSFRRKDRFLYENAKIRTTNVQALTFWSERLWGWRNDLSATSTYQCFAGRTMP